MAELKFKNRCFTLRQYESVLDCLLRNAEAVPYACKAGMCQACLVKAVACEATPESKKWVKPALQAKGYTLACQWVPEQDVQVALPSVEEFSVAVRIRALNLLSDSVMQLLLDVSDPASMFAYRPGQYLSLINPMGIARSYSIANDYEADGFIELHIARTSHGIFTHWVFTTAAIGSMLHMRGPTGDCYYHAAFEKDQPLLLAGTGTGLAPLYGIALDALGQGHTGSIKLYHGGRSSAQLYYVDELRALARAHKNFSYLPSTIETGNSPGTFTGKLEQNVAQQLDPEILPRTLVFLCGAPEFVHDMRKRIYLKGGRSANIFCDPFTERKVVPD
jgi:CDP-4-dehydro-6-deoxyglucose reductase, E3